MRPSVRSVWVVLVALVVAGATGVRSNEAQEPASQKTYELRIYTASAGRLQDLQNLIGAEGLRAFKAHGVENILDATVSEGAPIDAPDANNMLVLVLAHKDRKTADSDWAAVDSDPAWKSAWSKAETHSPLLAKPVSYLFLDTIADLPTPPIESLAPGAAASRTFELRKYNTGSERLPNMIAEFKEGIAALLVNSGMTPIIYWKASDQSSFVYLLAHKDREAARASWAAFLPDFRPFMAEFNARHLQPVPPGSPAAAPVRRAPDDNRFLMPTAFSPLR